MADALEHEFGAICIDTSVFWLADYSLDRGLLEQLHQFKGSPVKVVISEVVDRELTRLLAERVREAREAFLKGLKDIRQEMRVSDASALRARKAVLSSESDEEIARRRLEEFYQRCDATIVPADSVSSHDVLARYFNHQPPFAAAGDKKHAFPDAYALMSLEKWAAANGCKMLVVSYDPDWKEFCDKSERLAFCGDLGIALDLLQPHTAAEQLLSDLQEVLTSPSDESGFRMAITESIVESVEATEVNVDAESSFHWRASDVLVEFKAHEFYGLHAPDLDIDLVRVSRDEIVVRLMAKITYEVHASFALSMWDPTGKDDIGLGSQANSVEQSVDTGILVTFEGDFAEGLRGVAVQSVEVVQKLPTAHFGDIEFNGNNDEDEEPEPEPEPEADSDGDDDENTETKPH